MANYKFATKPQNIYSVHTKQLLPQYNHFLKQLNLFILSMLNVHYINKSWPVSLEIPA